VIARSQLLALGFSPKAIDHRIAVGRLRPIFRGVYSVGRAEPTRYGWWTAAILRCGSQGALSHWSAASLWGIGTFPNKPIHVSVPTNVARRQPGIVIHRRARLEGAHVRQVRDIPVTSVAWTLMDLAPHMNRGDLEAAINEADKLDLADPESLRCSLEDLAHHPGVAALRNTLDRRTFTMTRSQLERWFLPLVRAVGLPLPQTLRRVNGFEVDFFWADLGLVVETDGLRYHRTPAAQARDLLRDQAHAAAGLVPLRFTHAQVRYEPAHVEATLRRVARRLS
jgi:very-short-patch-repair endonuclease